MLHVTDECHTGMIAGSTWLEESLGALEYAASMSAEFANAWDVEQVVDPFDNISIIVISTSNSCELPVFVLYMENGRPRVATIRDDLWEADQTFSSCPLAVARILTAIRGLQLAG